jgi:hypothetical protein
MNDANVTVSQRLVDRLIAALDSCQYLLEQNRSELKVGFPDIDWSEVREQMIRLRAALQEEVDASREAV